jgi:hypothetical protein
LPPWAEQLGGEPTEIELHKIGPENFVPNKGSVQLAWTIPPYYNAEHYSSEASQSFIKFRTPQSWLNGFLGASLSNCHAGLAASGILAVNIANVASYPNLSEDFLWLARPGSIIWTPLYTTPLVHKYGSCCLFLPGVVRRGSPESLCALPDRRCRDRTPTYID